MAVAYCVKSLPNDAPEIAETYSQLLGHARLRTALVQFLTEAPSVPRVDAIALGIRSAPRRPTTLAIYALIDLSDLVKDGSPSQETPTAISEVHLPLYRAIRAIGPTLDTTLDLVNTYGCDLESLASQIEAGSLQDPLEILESDSIRLEHFCLAEIH